MTLSRRGLLAAGASASMLGACATLPSQTATGPFKPTWDSLAAGYKTPDWFRDAKFGIWSHWGPQCVPEFGDWYGRQMYIQGNPFYDHHVATYGHPSRFGFMELIDQFKATSGIPRACWTSIRRRAPATSCRWPTTTTIWTCSTAPITNGT